MWKLLCFYVFFFCMFPRRLHGTVSKPDVRLIWVCWRICQSSSGNFVTLASFYFYHAKHRRLHLFLFFVFSLEIWSHMWRPLQARRYSSIMLLIKQNGYFNLFFNGCLEIANDFVHNNNNNNGHGKHIYIYIIINI